MVLFDEEEEEEEEDKASSVRDVDELINEGDDEVVTRLKFSDERSEKMD